MLAVFTIIKTWQFNNMLRVTPNKNWTADQDNYLLSLSMTERKDWNIIAEKLNKHPIETYRRFKTLQETTKCSNNCLTDDLKKFLKREFVKFYFFHKKVSYPTNLVICVHCRKRLSVEFKLLALVKF